MKEKFVLSSSDFETIVDAEKKVTAWWENGELKPQKPKLFKVVEVYDLKLKFIKRKK